MPNHTRAEKLEAFGRIIDTLDILRVKCPWDAKQTNESLRPNTIEEVYELTQALMDNNASEIRKELGDVLLHILFYAKIGDENGLFDIADVADALNDTKNKSPNFYNFSIKLRKCLDLGPTRTAPSGAGTATGGFGTGAFASGRGRVEGDLLFDAGSSVGEGGGVAGELVES